MIRKSLALYCFFSYMSLAISAQETIPFSSDRWQLNGDYERVEYKGQQSLLLKNRATASLPDVQFKNGIIDYDIAFGSERGFYNVKFRMQDEANYEEFYLRAHQSGNPDAMQYTPVYNGNAGWQLYYGDGYSTAHPYRFNEWMHVRLIIADDQMEVYIDDMEKPVLHAFQLKQPVRSGYLGLAASLTQAYFANFSYRPMDRPTLKSPARTIPEPAPHTVRQWQVSNVFDGRALQGKHTLPEEWTKAPQWTTLNCEYSGVVNLSQVNARTPESNTVFARFTVESDRDQVKALQFGYSDDALIYCNGALLYGGQRRYQSQDYRYLGTIGYFDTVYLPLKKGRNEVWFAVGEAFGGWGVQARFTDGEGIGL